MKSQRSLGRCLPRVERLESRLALSASAGGDLPAAGFPDPAATTVTTTSTPTNPYLSVVSTDPAAGATLTSPTSSVSVTFDRAVDPTSLGTGDIFLDTPNLDGGGMIQAFKPSASAESLDSTGMVLTLTLPHPIAAGSYQLVLSGGSFLAGVDGRPPAGSITGSDVVLSEFSVARPGVTLADAQDLGTLSDAPAVADGVLDLRANPGAIGLDKFTVPAGHEWRVGAEVVAQRDGSALQSTLAVFDAQGRPIAVSSAGRPDAPNDSYLFVKLGGGTYYLGVSGRGNVPGLSGGYDPATGRTGALPTAQDGGSYHLDVVADPADAPTRSLGFALNYADPIDPQPTGLTIAFSGLLDAATVRGTPSPGLTLVDQDGRSFPLTVVGTDAQAQYTFLFNQPLPAGHYDLRAPDKAQGGVTDLGGSTPVTPGLPAGVLASFDVRAVENTDPTNIGPLYDSVNAGINFTDAVTPGTAVSYRFVVTVPGIYHVASQYQGEALSAQLLGPGGLTTLSGGSPGESVKNNITLTTGVYLLQWANDGTTPLALTWGIKKDTPWDSLLDNGVGQGPALNLRLVNPTSSNLATGTTSAPPGPQATPATQAPSGPLGLGGPSGPAVVVAPAFGSPSIATAAPTAIVGSVSLIVTTPAPPTLAAAHGSSAVGGSNGVVNPAGLVISVADTLVGRPTTEGEHVAVVGPNSQSGSVALASVASGMPAGIGYGPSKGWVVANPAGVGVNPAGEPASPEPLDGALVVRGEDAPPRRDEQAIASADWLSRLGNNAARWFSLAPGEAPDPAATEPAAEPIVMTRDDSRSEVGADRVEEAHLSAPLAVGLASLMALRGHGPFRRWLDRNRREPSTSVRRTLPLAGPHGPRRRA